MMEHDVIQDFVCLHKALMIISGLNTPCMGLTLLLTKFPESKPFMSEAHGDYARQQNYCSTASYSRSRYSLLSDLRTAAGYLHRFFLVLREEMAQSGRG